MYGADGDTAKIQRASVEEPAAAATTTEAGCPSVDDGIRSDDHLRRREQRLRGCCPIGADGTCATLSENYTCTAATCDAVRLDTGGDASNGCDAGCPSGADGSCTTCFDASTCTAVACAAAHVDEDGDASTGSEGVCPKVCRRHVHHVLPRLPVHGDNEQR